MDFQWMKDENGKICAMWFSDEQNARNQSLLQQLAYSEFGMLDGLQVVGKLSSAKVLRNPDARGGWYVLFDSPFDPPK